MAGLEQPTCLIFHKRPECWLSATDPLQQSNTLWGGYFWAAFWDWAGGWHTYLLLQAVSSLQLIRCSRASQEWVAFSGQLYQTEHVGGRLGAARVPAISPKARVLAYCNWSIAAEQHRSGGAVSRQLFETGQVGGRLGAARVSAIFHKRPGSWLSATDAL